jgi:hypothetical protein
MTDFASQAGHWYDAKTGEPRYTIEAKQGGRRATTIRDARAFGYVPSVTTILKVAAKPALTEWLINQALDAALTLPRLPGESADDFKKRARTDSGQQTRDAADAGSALHASLEGHFKGGMVPADHIPHCVTVGRELAAKGFVGPWDAERSFASPLGYGGKMDLASENCVADFKSKPFLEGGKKYAFDEHGLQLAAYAHGIGRPDAALVNVFVGLKDAAVLVHVWPQEDTRRFWRMFRLLLAYWQEANNFGTKLAEAA